MTSDDILYHISPRINNDALNELFAAAWRDHQTTDFESVLRRSLLYICAYRGHMLVGYVNVAWDGGIHAFLLDPTVHPSVQRHGIGQNLVRAAAAEAKMRGIHWLHVDYEPQLDDFYRACGFQRTMAGIMWLAGDYVRPGPQTD